MPNTLLHKRNSTANSTPAAENLTAGELAINTADGRLFTKNSADAVINLPVTSIAGQTINPSNITAGTTGDTRVAVTGVGGENAISEYYAAEANPRWVLGRDLIGGGNAGVGFGVGTSTVAAGGVGIGYAAAREMGFYTSNATALTERMRITGAGDVGIGITNPGSRLVVKGAGTTSGTTALNVTNSADASLFFVRNDGNIGINNNAPGSRLVIKGAGAGPATSALNVTNSSNTSLLFVQNDGKVGVGTATPAQKLDVTGVIAATQTVIGTDNILDAAATHACVIGGSRAKASLYGEIAHAAGGFTNVEGTAQHRILVARGITLSGAFTVSIASPAVFTKIGHSLSVGDTVKLSTTGALPTGLNTTATYHVISAGLTADEFRLSTTAGGAAINTSGTQSGTHTLTPTTSLTLNGAIGLTTPSRLVIPERSTWAFTIKISAYSSQNNQGAAWWLTGGLRRNLTTTVELENVQGFQYAEASFGAPGALIDISADTVNNALDIRVTGIINQSVRWAAVVDIIQVSFGTP